MRTLRLAFFQRFSISAYKMVSDNGRLSGYKMVSDSGRSPFYCTIHCVSEATLLNSHLSKCVKGKAQKQISSASHKLENYFSTPVSVQKSHLISMKGTLVIKTLNKTSILKTLNGTSVIISLNENTE